MSASTAALSWQVQLLLLYLAISLTIAYGQGSWQVGRGTMYGNDMDPDALFRCPRCWRRADAWSIHKGSCGYGFIRQDEPLGWNVAALPDVSPYYPNSCGICFEIKCNPSTFTDGYGEALDRNSACYDPDASLVFRITDTCPCVYPDNAYSNKRWCCGDMQHFDLSVWGFERLASTKWGVIGLQYRQVPCSYQPERQAPTISNPTPSTEQPPWGSSNVVRDWPEMDNRTVVSIYNGGAQNGWQDASYNVQPGSSMGGMISGTAKCASTQPKGAIVFKSYNKGAFADHVAVGVYIYMSTSTQIDKGIVMAIGGDAGDCIVVDLTDVKATGFVPRCKGCTDYWWKFEVYLSAFAGFGPTSIINNAKYFKGCGGNDVNQLTYMEIRNYRNSAMNLCVDDVRLQ